jgi:phosphate starvation-inducible PhoH-like protein
VVLRAGSGERGHRGHNGVTGDRRNPTLDANSAVILRHTFEPLDNARLSHLCGPIEANLRDLEAALGVKVERRHEFFRIEGPKAQAQQALTVMQSLYEGAAEPISPEMLRLALLSAQGRVAAGVPAGEADELTRLRTRRADLRARSVNQEAYVRSILSHDIVLGIGPAGTGKTYLAVACAVDALERQAVQRIVLTRPAVEAGERLGFLPGDVAQKVDPYLRPLYDALYDLMGTERVARAMDKGVIDVAPLAFMRGRTLNHAFVILDEAQNTTPEQMKMLLTRLGFGSKCVVAGDISQIDLPAGQESGLVEAERALRRVPGVAISRLTAGDVVRHPLVAKVVEAYAQDRLRADPQMEGGGHEGRSTWA